MDAKKKKMKLIGVKFSKDNFPFYFYAKGQGNKKSKNLKCLPFGSCMWLRQDLKGCNFKTESELLKAPQQQGEKNLFLLLKRMHCFIALDKCKAF